jgi:hypothetical protein
MNIVRVGYSTPPSRMNSVRAIPQIWSAFLSYQFVNRPSFVCRIFCVVSNR